MRHKSWLFIGIIGVLTACFGAGCQDRVAPPERAALPAPKPEPTPEPAPVANDTLAKLETATFGMGCYWCTEAVFQSLKGVQSVKSGFSGGFVKNPTYEDVCSEKTGHAEVSQIVFDPKVIAYKDLLEVFWKTHDPTTLNQQGADFGAHYRSVVFYHNDEQKRLAQSAKKALDEAGLFPAPIVTAIEPFAAFYPAKDAHQNYFQKNPELGYCRAVILPKLEKLHKLFQDKVR